MLTDDHEDTTPMLHEDSLSKTQGNAINFHFANLIMVTSSFGSAVVTMPYIMKVLDPINWGIIALSVIFILTFTGILLKESIVYMMQNLPKDGKYDRETWQILAEFAVNKRFGIIVKWSLYISLFTNVMSNCLIAATIASQSVELDISHYNRIRVWLAICYIISTPFMLFGSYKDMKLHAIMGIVTATIALASVILICLKYVADGNSKDSSGSVYKVTPIKLFFTTYGVIFFSAAGPAMTAPFLLVQYDKPKRFERSYITSNAVILCVFVVCASFPYFILNHADLQPNIIDTFYGSVMRHSHGSFYRYSTLIIAVCLTIHLLTAAVFLMNPACQSLESKLNIPKEFSWKRIVLRISILIVLLVISLAFPFFLQVMSLIGALPLALMLVIYPIITYYYIFTDTISLFTKVVLLGLTIFTLTFMVTNSYYTILDISKVLKKT